jgi:hypothetical protein
MNSALSTRAGQAEGGVCGFVSPHLRRWRTFQATIRCGFLRTSPTEVSSPTTCSGNSPAPATVGGLGTLKLAGSSTGCFAVPRRSESSSPVATSSAAPTVTCIPERFPRGRSSGPLRPGPPTSPRLGPRCCSPLLMQSTGALANETSQELGGSCANTRDSDIVSTASPPDTIGPCSGGATGGGELRNVLAGPPTISTQGNSTIPSGRGWAIGGCSSSAIRPAGHRSGASRTNSRISGSSAARRSRAAVSPG